MNTLNKLIAAIALTFIALQLQAHEGHDHDAPKGLVAPKGGQIKALEQTLVEVVARGTAVKIYLYDKELKPQDPKLYTVTAQAEKPRVKKRDDVPLIVKEGALEATYDAKGLHRYTLHLKVKDPKEDHFDNVKFTIEPKK